MRKIEQKECGRVGIRKVLSGEVAFEMKEHPGKGWGPQIVSAQEKQDGAGLDMLEEKQEGHYDCWTGTKRGHNDRRI